MTSGEKKATLLSLLDNWEDEVVEFKSGDKGFSSDEIGKYFSALSNEANLRGLEAAWLVFGVHNKTRKIIGTDYDVSSYGHFGGSCRGYGTAGGIYEKEGAVRLQIQGHAH